MYIMPKSNMKKKNQQFQPIIFIPVVRVHDVINYFSLTLLFKGKWQCCFGVFFVWNIVFSQMNNFHENYWWLILAKLPPESLWEILHPIVNSWEMLTIQICRYFMLEITLKYCSYYKVGISCNTICNLIMNFVWQWLTVRIQSLICIQLT